MGFKTDREFLRNVSIGAIGTRKVAKILQQGGFRIIELERYSGSNKIWATKIKRLRVPDLLCLKSGTRIESRAKSTLKVTMSHAVNNPDRAWDKGLRDDDLVAFILCYAEDDTWKASDRINLFRVGDMRSTAGRAGLSQMKAASEGSEIQLTWPSTIPGRAGEVSGIDEVAIYTLLEGGRKQKYNITRTDDDDVEYRFGVYVDVGDTFGPADTIIASAVTGFIPPICPDCEQYDFIADLGSGDRETSYAAVKALGFMDDWADESKKHLVDILDQHEDVLVRLEAASALGRLGINEGWSGLDRFVKDTDAAKAVQMETALILSELGGEESRELLKEIANNSERDSDLRSAATWGLSMVAENLSVSGLVDLMTDEDESVAVHAICGATRLTSEESLNELLDEIDDDTKKSAGIVRTILASQCDAVPIVVEQIKDATNPKRQWLLYLLVRLGRDRCEAFVNENAPELLTELEFFWSNHEENWTNRLDVADEIDFLLQQILD